MALKVLPESSWYNLVNQCLFLMFIPLFFFSQIWFGKHTYKSINIHYYHHLLDVLLISTFTFNFNLVVNKNSSITIVGALKSSFLLLLDNDTDGNGDSLYGGEFVELGNDDNNEVGFFGIIDTPDLELVILL